MNPVSDPFLEPDASSHRAPLFIPALLFICASLIAITLLPLVYPILGLLIVSLVIWFYSSHFIANTSFVVALFCCFYLWTFFSLSVFTQPITGGGAITAQARVDAVDDLKSGGCQAVVTLTHIQEDCHSSFIGARLVTRFSSLLGPIEPGSFVQGVGVIEPIASSLNPGEFDSASYWRRRGVTSRWRLDQVQQIKKSDHYLYGLSKEIRNQFKKLICLGIEDDPQVCGLVQGMVLGVRTGISENVEREFRRTGTYHLFSVSGQNVGLLVIAGLMVMECLGLIKWRWGWLLIPLLVLFVFVTGLQSSAIRAAMMAGLVLCAWLLLRPVGALQLWSLALILMLLWEPGMVMDLGAQLSFSVVLSLILFTRPLTGWLYRLLPWDPLLPRSLAPWPSRLLDQSWKMLSSLAGVSLAAWLGSFPWMVLIFHQVSLSSVVANLLVVPLASVIVVSACLGLGFGLIHPSLEIAINNSVWLGLKTMLALVHLCAGIPGASWNVGTPSEWRSPSHPEMVLISSGESATGILRVDGEVWLVGTGSRYQVTRTVIPALRYYGINSIDQVVIPAMTAAQAGGMEVLMDEFQIQKIAIPGDQTPSPFARQWREISRKRKWPIEVWSRGEIRQLSGTMQCRVLSPVPELEARRWEDLGLVLQFSRESDRLLWAGNIGFGTESRLLRIDPDLSSSVLIQGRHGSEPNGSEAWKNALSLKDWIEPSRGFAGYRVTRESRFSDNPETGLRHWDQARTGALVIQWLEDGGINVRPWKNQTGSLSKIDLLESE